MKPKRNRPDDEIKARKVDLSAISVSDEAASGLAAFSRGISANLPEAAHRRGSYEPGDDPRFANAPRLQLKDGRYRVAGHDWILTLKGGRLSLMERAAPDVDPKTYVSVPND